MQFRFGGLALPALFSAFLIPSLYATSTFALPSVAESMATAPVVEMPITSNTKVTQINNGFNGVGAPTEPILAAATTLHTTTDANPARNMTVLSPSPAPAQAELRAAPWWMSFNTLAMSTPLVEPAPVLRPTSDFAARPLEVFNPQADGVPEPATLSIFAGGLACIWVYRRRTRVRHKK
jgi:hypothetical protein